jgi:hypothetical protein
MRATELGWYWRRLTRMSPSEVLHRLREQARRRMDARTRWSWEGFGAYEGAVRGLPGLDPDDAAVSDAALAGPASDALAGRFRFLGRTWPAFTASPWWRGDAWRLDPATGTLWPGADTFAFHVPYRHVDDKGDVKFVWELSRLQFLAPLALHAKRSGDAAAQAAVWDILDGWMEANPPFQGINWTSGIEAATRLVSVLAALSLGAPPPEAFQPRLRAFVAAHAFWLARYPSLFSSANNHRVSEVAALFLAGLCAPAAPGASGWLAEGLEGLEHEAPRQFHADGVGVEQSPTYAAYSLEWFTLAGIAAEAAGRPLSPSLRERLALAAEHLTWMLDDAGVTPRIGDDDEGRVLALGQAPEHRHVASVAAMTQRWLGLPPVAPRRRDPALRDLAAAASPAAEREPPEGLRTFAEGGYTVLRRATPSGPLLLVMDHGPLGFLSIAAHGHADALAVWLHWGDEPVIADAGTYLYHSGSDARDRFRGTPAHNTLAVQGADQSRISGPFNWSRHARTRLLDAGPDGVAAEHDGYRRAFGLTHRREVRFGAEAIDVIDTLDGAPLRAGLAWSLGYTLHPDVAVTLDGAAARLTTRAGRSLVLASLAADGGESEGPAWTLTEAPYSPAFNQRTVAPRLELSGVRGSSAGRVARTRIALG